ncbi:hypothetical protein [Chryseobacterium cheonjiense]|uniref:Cell wall anchor protein n=1 Tax=Chryseobacterium cheonjiense TaxID=2728845 RepID=A0A7Y0A8H9_9FLAO|nr:hypothetical protein [Chryseobacterium cheonjiense]NML58652.1 hypothetical protein [Chryseobacterium cheonjiense]
MKYIITMAVLLISLDIKAQVGINNNFPKATLDITAKTTDGSKPEGLIAPRLTGDQLQAGDAQYGNAQKGAIVYATAAATSPSTKTANIISEGYYFFDGTAWQKIIDGASAGDTTNDAWINDTATSIVKLGTKSDGTARTAGTDFVARDNGSVGIGTSIPDASAALEVNASNKGMLIPRVALTGSIDVVTIPSPVTGLMVYNTGAGALTYKGFVFWNGTEWRSLENETLINPNVQQIDCAKAFLSPAIYTAGVSYNGTLALPYSNGNGGKYNGGTTITNNGLTFKLLPGTLSLSGFLYFSVTGIPIVSSPTTSNITINNILIPFYTGSACTTQNIGTQETDSGETTSAGYDINTTTPNSSITCFDGGQFCVRYNGTTANQRLQVRQNYGSNQVALAYSYWGTGSSGTSSFKDTNLIQNVWTDIYDFGSQNNTEGANTTFILVDKTQAKIRSFQIEADIVIASEIGISGGSDKLFLKLTKN